MIHWEQIVLNWVNYVVWQHQTLISSKNVIEMSSIYGVLLSVWRYISRTYNMHRFSVIPLISFFTQNTQSSSSSDEQFFSSITTSFECIPPTYTINMCVCSEIAHLLVWITLQVNYELRIWGWTNAGWTLTWSTFCSALSFTENEMNHHIITITNNHNYHKQLY